MKKTQRSKHPGANQFYTATITVFVGSENAASPTLPVRGLVGATPSKVGWRGEERPEFQPARILAKEAAAHGSLVDVPGGFRSWLAILGLGIVISAIMRAARSQSRTGNKGKG